MKVHDSELKVLEALWSGGPKTASAIAGELKDSTGWSRNTTYTILKRCVEKGLIRRDEPKFLCTPLVSREDVRATETDELIDRMYDGSRSRFFAALLSSDNLTESELQELRALIDGRRR